MVRRYTKARDDEEVTFEATADLLIDDFVVASGPHVAKRRLAHAHGAGQGICGIWEVLSVVEHSQLLLLVMVMTFVLKCLLLLLQMCDGG